MKSRFVVLVALAVGSICAAPVSASAQSETTIDFEQFTGPTAFSTVDAPFTVGIATFSGGQLLRTTANLPANQSTVYGTSNHCAGCAETLTVVFAQPVRDFSIEIFNGEITSVTYTVAADSGGSQTKKLASNALSGADTFTLPDLRITSVTVSSEVPVPEFPTHNFSVDNLRFTPVGTDSLAGSASECTETIELGPGQIQCTRKPSIDVDVRSGAGGENPTGSVDLGSVGLTPGGSVVVDAEATCLSVTGRVATIGLTGTFHQGGQGFDAWIEGLIRVTDAGGPASGADAIEVAYRTSELSGPPPAGPTTCSAFPGPFGRDSLFFPDFSNATGDLAVTDAPPTTYEQCRQAGWVKYGYSSHAECSSAVHDLARMKCVFERAAHGLLPFRAKYGRGPNHDYAMRRCIRRYTGF
jgi:hypothetical protein